MADDRSRATYGEFTGYRFIKGTGSLRVEIDVPAEQVTDALALLGKPGCWIGLAKLKNEPEAQDPPKRKWEELSPAQQAGIRCEDPTFQQFAAHRAGRTSIDVADWVRGQCGVDSRSELNRNQDAADAWRMVEADYQSWLTTQRYAEAMR